MKMGDFKKVGRIGGVNRSIVNPYPFIFLFDPDENHSSNFLIRTALFTPPKPADMERPSLTSFFLA